MVWKPLSGYEMTTHCLYQTQVSSVTDLERYFRDAPQVASNTSARSAGTGYSQRLNHCSREMRRDSCLQSCPWTLGSCLTTYLPLDMCSVHNRVFHFSPLLHPRSKNFVSKAIKSNDHQYEGCGVALLLGPHLKDHSSLLQLGSEHNTVLSKL